MNEKDIEQENVGRKLVTQKMLYDKKLITETECGLKKEGNFLSYWLSIYLFKQIIFYTAWQY